MGGVAEERFWEKVERGPDHDEWTGARSTTGTGLVRIDGELRTVQRAVWEFAHGPLRLGEKVRACTGEKACVRLSHLCLISGERRTVRQQWGSGSLRETRPGVWRLVVSDGPGQGGRARRRSRTVYGTRQDAEAALRDLAETTKGPSRLGDLRVRELLDRYIAWLDEPDASLARGVVDAYIEPLIGRDFAALLDTGAVEALLRRLHTEVDDIAVRTTLQTLDHAYEWARRQRWTRLTPTDGVGLR